MAFKTFAQLAVATDVQDGDLFATYRGSGPLKSLTATIHYSYLVTKLTTAGSALLANTAPWSAAQTISVNTATTVGDYLALKPTDYAAGKPGLFFSKSAVATTWQAQLYDGATVAGQLDLKLTLLNITGSLAVSGTMTFGALSITGALSASGGFTLTGSTKQNVAALAALDVDLSASDFFTKSISANSSFTFSGATASVAQAFILELTIASAAVPTWPASVKWAGGAAPSLGNGRHVIGFVTFNGGTIWTGMLGAQNAS